MLSALLLIGCSRFGSSCDSRSHEATASPPPALRESADAAPVALAGVARGKALYARYCAFCHAPDGRGYAADEATAVANVEFLATASDAYLREAIARGRPRTTMSAWSVARGGPLLDDDITAVVAYFRTWQARPYASVDSRVVTGSAARGAPIYASKCAACHGKSGEEGKYVALANPRLLATASDGFLAAAIERGRPGTPMPAFADALSPAEVGDVVALIRSWQKPADDSVRELPPPPDALKNAVVHPRGPSPTWDPKADFVSVDAVRAEIQRGATMVLADARAPSDYVEMHLAGAVSVPFYRVQDYAGQIPKDRYVITYCACPHAESVLARDEFRRLGYARVAVLDEGINAWRDRGYPTRGGAKP